MPKKKQIKPKFKENKMSEMKVGGKIPKPKKPKGVGKKLKVV